MGEPLGVWVAIGAGSAVGGVLRHAATLAVAAAAGPGFPWGTLLVNVTGSWAMGALTGLALSAPGAWSPTVRQGLSAGLLGGYTTFSAFSLQTVSLIAEGRWAAGGANVILSIVSCVAACWIGFATTTALAR
jgi:CrcB protein